MVDAETLMPRPRLLDLFCGAGGAGMGYHRAGFEVVGVDVKYQRHYPFEFVQADAIEYLAEHGDEYAVIHASPPCQRWSLASGYAKNAKERHPDLIEPLREMLDGRIYVIENVPRAPIRPDVRLTGPMFGLWRIERVRHFEVSHFCLQPPLQHVARSAWESGMAGSITTSLSSNSHFYKRKAKGLRGRIPVPEACEMMGIDWPMTAFEVGEAIPPAYTEFIGSQLIERLGERV